LVAINIALVVADEHLVGCSTSKNDFDYLVDFARGLCINYTGKRFDNLVRKRPRFF
jgi:hypothetical protein